MEADQSMEGSGAKFFLLSEWIVFMFLSWQTEVYLHDKPQVCHIVLLGLNKLLQYIPAMIQDGKGLILETGFRFILQPAHRETFHFIKPT